MKIAVLGAGMIGRTIAKDLAKKHEVISVDKDARSLENLENIKGITTLKTNLSSFSTYKKILEDCDLCVCAVPGFLGYDALESIIKTGTNVVDISFSRENTMELDALAKKHNVTAVIDCGVAPGMSNIILGYYNSIMEVESFECLVGGLPKERKPPFEYKAPFSPIDVIEEYTRPARIKENGEIVVKPALSEAELIEFKEVGTLESFNTDGLRTVLHTMPHIKNMKEKTLRYPGHISLITALIQAGFLNDDKIMVDGSAISRKDFTCKVLFDQWRLNPDDEEFTLMQIVIKGKKDGKQMEVEYFLYDEYDKKNRISSMSRTTAFTATAVAELVLNKKINAKGIIPPEIVGSEEEAFKFILRYLKDRDVNYKATIN